MKFMKYRIIPALALAALLAAIFGAYSAVYAGKIYPSVSIGSVHVGGMTRTDARQEVERRIALLQKQGIQLRHGTDSEVIGWDDISGQVDATSLVDRAFAIGREGAWYAQFGARILSPVRTRVIETGISYDAEALTQSLSAVASLIDNPGRDIRFKITGLHIEVLTDTKVGHVMDQIAAREAIERNLHLLSTDPITIKIKDDIPVRDPASVASARLQAGRLLKDPLSLHYETYHATISEAMLATWIASGTDGTALIPVGDREAISAFVTKIAQEVNVAAQTPVLSIQDGRVVQFQPPRSGKALEEEKTVQLILDELDARRTKKASPAPLELPVKITKPVSDVINGPNGIVELIGKATTTFTGSPANRISNIKNGVKFLSGSLVAPGAEFSTLGTLGTIDNTTGYLPELVIREDRTVPEFGGGLCQVSTTLFRAVLNAGLPVTERRNHSYRVSYYEKDGEGKYLGPGLDATIFEPDPDLKFLNDTGAYILIYAYVVRDTVTFELYGTHDSRTATIKGPTLLTSIPAGDPIYTETDTLPAGVTKQVETPHPGGTATALYTVKYPDGHVATKEFKSSYRRWPARYLVGTGGASPTPTPLPSFSPSPSATPIP